MSKIANIKKPRLINVAIDRLTIVRSVEGKEISQGTTKVREWQRKYGFANGNEGFKYGAGVTLNETGDKLKILAKDNGQQKFVFNPARLSINELIHVRELLQFFLGDEFDDLWENGCVQELHPALDFAYANPHDLGVRRKHQRCGGVFSNDAGETETIYLGGAKPPAVVYNKTSQLKSVGWARRVNKYPRISHYIGFPEFDMMRLEDRWRNVKRSPKALLTKTADPLSKVTFVWLSALKAEGLASQTLIDSICYRGLHPALKHIEPGQADAIRKYLAKHGNCFVSPELVQKQLLAAHAMLHIFAPQAVFEKWLSTVPEYLRNYRHTGIITKHFIDMAYNADKKHITRSHDTDADIDWYNEQKLGSPITFEKAAELIRVNDLKLRASRPKTAFRKKFKNR